MDTKELIKRIEFLIEREKGDYSLDKPKDPEFYTGDNCWICEDTSASWFRGIARICSTCRGTIEELAEDNNDKKVLDFSKKIQESRKNRKLNLQRDLIQRLDKIKEELELSEDEIKIIQEAIEKSPLEIVDKIGDYEQKIIKQKELKERERLEKEIEKYKKNEGIYFKFEEWINGNRGRFERYKEIKKQISEEVLELFSRYIERYSDEDFLDNLPKLKKLLEHKIKIILSDEEFRLLIQELYFSIRLVSLTRELRGKEEDLEEIANHLLNSINQGLENWDAVELIKKIIETNKLKFSINEIVEKLTQIKESRELENFEQKLLRTNKRPSKKEIEKMTGIEFEKFVGSCFEDKGYKVKITKATGDQGADLVLEDEKGILTAVQVKKYSGSVGNKAVQEVVASMKFYDCDKAMIVTTGEFTKSAFELASKNGVQLISKKELDDLI